MNRRCPGVAATAVLVLGGMSVCGAQGPTFRLATDLVPVYVAVRADRSLIGGLGSSDFALTDRGVPQTVEVASSDAVPVDVTLVVDTSRSVINSLPQFRADVTTIVGQLRPEEQLRLITFDTEVRQILPMQPSSGRAPVSRMRQGETTALADAVVLALARARRPERRHLVFVFTDGYDTSSVLGYGALPDLASRTDSLVHIALVRPSGADSPTAAALAALSATASRTGGSLYPPSENDAGLVAAFQRAIDDFRHSYVLYFSPSGVSGAGWHDIAVRVLKPGSYDVRARAGYFAR
jgi:VWFA-related protein